VDKHNESGESILNTADVRDNPLPSLNPNYRPMKREMVGDSKKV
jgi:hypothetical protein